MFCILILINGTNFIDGLNTLVLGYFILVLVAIISVAFKFDFALNENEFLFLIILVVLLIFNFFEKIYLGDSGSYIVGMTIAFFLLKFINKNQVVSPYFICLLLWYPAFENLFTILRRLSCKRKTYKADQQHLHQLLYFYFLKKFKKNNFLTNIFRFFTQGDIDVAGGYVKNYLPYFPQPEIRMMLLGFAAREALHVAAYSHLIETLGMPESTYN